MLFIHSGSKQHVQALTCSMNIQPKDSIPSCTRDEQAAMEKRIRISTQGRITIPKAMRDRLKLKDGQAIVILSDEVGREILLKIQPMITEYQ